jgi:hypothetical protein
MTVENPKTKSKNDNLAGAVCNRRPALIERRYNVWSLVIGNWKI